MAGCGVWADGFWAPCSGCRWHRHRSRWFCSTVRTPTAHDRRGRVRCRRRRPNRRSPRRERSRSGDRRHPGHPRGRGRRALGTLVDRGSWTDRHEAGVLRDALAARQINNVMLVPALRAHRGAVRGARHRDDSTRGNLRRLRRRRPPGEHPTPSPTTRTSRTLGRRWPGSTNRNRPRAGCSWSAPVPTSPRCGRRPGRGCQSLDLRHRGPFRPPDADQPRRRPAC